MLSHVDSASRKVRNTPGLSWKRNGMTKPLRVAEIPAFQKWQGRNGYLREKADGRQLRLLRARRERPGDRSAAKQRYELAAVHSITSSARANSVGGISKPSVPASFRMMISSNFLRR